eukprot:Rhum_TRINITY_DN23481_c0_g1::Rhum_TRINITY_DN23481_c0_g1_i1::g.177979::m.177979
MLGSDGAAADAESSDGACWARSDEHRREELRRRGDAGLSSVEAVELSLLEARHSVFVAHGLQALRHGKPPPAPMAECDEEEDDGGNQHQTPSWLCCACCRGSHRRVGPSHVG